MNAELIAELREFAGKAAMHGLTPDTGWTIIPALLDALEASQQENARLREALDDVYFELRSDDTMRDTLMNISGIINRERKGRKAVRDE